MTPIQPATPTAPIAGFTPSGWEIRERRQHATRGEIRQLRTLLLRALDAIEDGGLLSAEQARFLLQHQLRQTEERVTQLLLQPERHWVPRGDLTLPIWHTVTFDPVPISESVQALKYGSALCPDLEQVLIDAGWLEGTSTSIDTPTPVHLVRFNAGQVFKPLLGDKSSYGALSDLLDTDTLKRASWSALSTGSLRTLPLDLALQLQSLGVLRSDEPVVIATPNISPRPFWKVLRCSRFSSSGKDYGRLRLQEEKSMEAGGMECCNADVIFQYVPDPDMTQAGAE